MAQQDPTEDQLVRVEIPLSGDPGTKAQLDQYAKLEDDLDAAATKSGVGHLDGNEIGEGLYSIWMYGHDATKLAETVNSVLKGRSLPKGCKLFLRHGGIKDANAKEETIRVVN